MTTEPDDQEWAAGLPLLGRLAGHALRDITALVAVLGGSLYALIAISYERFYRYLGIDPKDVGITPATIVTRTAVGLALIIAVGVGAYCGCFALVILLFRRSTPGIAAVAALGGLAIIGPGLLVVVGMRILVEPGFVTITGALVVVLLGACLGSMWILRRAQAPRMRTALFAIWVAVLAFFFFGGFVFTSLRTYGLAHQVLAGVPIPPAGQTLEFNIHADLVCVRHDGAAARPSPPSYRLYLGEANGWLALYDPVKRVTERLPSQGRSLTFLPQPGPRSC